MECHRLEEEAVALEEADVEVATPSAKVAPGVDVPELEPGNQKDDTEPVALDEPTPRLKRWLHFMTRRDIWVKILQNVSHNPVLWAIAGGFFLTLSTIGPSYLNEKSEDFVPGLSWISDTLYFIGNTVTPVSLFTMGVWMSNEGTGMFRMNTLAAVGCMASKLIFVPLVMVGLAKLLALEDEPGRAAVLIASLPISMASFSLANRYKIGEAVMAENVALGTLLVLPTVVVWNLVLDEAGLFPILRN